MKALPAGGTRYTPADAGTGARVLVVDNYDSFTFNLVQYLLELGAVVDVYRNDALTAAQIVADAPSHVLLSPGPGRPSDAGVCWDVCRLLCGEGPSIPLLGVCLGHQTLCEVLGADVVRAERIMHGKTSPVLHDGTGILSRIPSPFIATRYHSLIVPQETLPPSLVAVAHTAQGELMAVRHVSAPVFGVQFHPESILSEAGHQILGNFLAQGGRSA
jgi:anthranilate synthase/aminodeoxychorismate synthase-like glutamine amidotransferase